MSDQNFHEIQLSGKQLVFLFMCAVVLTVVVFLFGVSVGRGVRPDAGQNAQVEPAAGAPSSSAPAGSPSAAPSANELSYAEALEGKPVEDPSKAVPPSPPAEEPPASTPVSSAPKTAEPKSATLDAAAKTSAPQSGREPVKSAVPDGWVVQVGAFNANDVAGREVTKLQSKGYPAFVFTEPETTPGPRFKVRVGPYSARAEADRMLRNLTREGYKPLLKR